MGMRRKVFAVGERIGKWTVLEEAGLNRHGMSQSLCRCDCGKEALVINANLRVGKTTRCRSCVCKLMQGSHIEAIRKLSDDDVHAIRRELRSGSNPHEVAEKYNITARTAWSIDKGQIWKNIPWRDGLEPRPSRKHNRVSKEVVREVKRRLAAGQRNRDICKEMGLSSALVSAVRVGRIHKDV